MGREPTPAELGETLGMPEDKVRRIQKISKEPVSIQQPVGDDDSTIGDFIEDYDAIDPLNNLLGEDLRNLISDTLDKTLTAREAKVLRMRFGIGINNDHTLEEVGRQFDVTRERIRQIEAKSLRKLRHVKNAQKIKNYLQGNTEN